MPTYRIAHPNGKTIKIEGDAPPTEAELDDIFASIDVSSEASDAQPQPKGASLGQRVSNIAAPFMAPFEGAAILGRQAVKGYKGIEEAAGLAFPPTPGAMLEEDLAVKGARLARQGAEILLPQTAGQAVLQATGEGVVAALPEAVGAARVTLSPYAERLVALAKEKGVPLTAGEIMKSKLILKLEAGLEKFAPAIGSYRERQFAALRDLAKSIGDKFGESASRGEVGQILDNARRELADAAYKVKNEAYDHWAKLMEPRSRADASPL